MSLPIIFTITAAVILVSRDVGPEIWMQIMGGVESVSAISIVLSTKPNTAVDTENINKIHVKS